MPGTVFDTEYECQSGNYSTPEKSRVQTPISLAGQS